MTHFYTLKTINDLQAEIRRRAHMERMARRSHQLHSVKDRVGAQLVHLGVTMIDDPETLRAAVDDVEERWHREAA